jgi:flagellar hook-associated protein 3 FlgL
VAATVRSALAGIDAGMTHLSAWRSRAGEALNRIDAIEGRLAQQRLDSEQARSEAQDVDMVAAISSFQTLQTSYDAALKTYSMVQRLSLFDYLR